MFLAKQKGKLPSDVKAYFIDEDGFIVRYDDVVPTSKTRRRLERAKREIAEGKGLTLEEVRKRLGGQHRIPYTLNRPRRHIEILDVGKHDEAYRRLRKRR